MKQVLNRNHKPKLVCLEQTGPLSERVRLRCSNLILAGYYINISARELLCEPNFFCIKNYIGNVDSKNTLHPSVVHATDRSKAVALN